MSIVKSFLYLILAFILTFTLTFFIYYEDIKSDAVEKFQKQNHSSFIYLNELLKNTTLNNDFTQINSSIKTFLSIDILQDIELTYKRFIFSKKAILINSNKINNVHYRLSDVTTDYKYGKINILDENTYEFIPNILFNTQETVAIKFQAYDDGDVYNSTSNLNFYKQIKNENKTKIEEQSWLNKFITFENIDANKSFLIEYEKTPFVEVKYTLNKSSLIEQTVLFIKKIFVYSFSLFVITIIILYLFYTQIVKKDIEKPIEKIGDYIADILNNKYVRLEKINTKLMHIDTIFSKLQLMSKKVASLTNELNINRELLNRKDLVDEITGLPNKKVFEKEIKAMFITNKSGYIILGKINNLGDFANKNGSNAANNLIKDFGHSIVKLLKKYSKIKSSVYRFYGAEFAVIINIDNLNELQKILKEVSHSVQDYIKGQYLIDGDIVYFGATPFDNYGTLDTILHSAHESYLECVKNKHELFAISDNAAIMEKTKQMEILVKEIIETEDFTIKFIYDTFEMDSDNKLIMQDASPIILDTTTYEMFPIGIFISVAEKLQLSSMFDKILIEKVLNYLEYEKIEHKIAINLSMKSLTDRKFLSWLEGILLYNEIAKEKLVFSVTSLNAKENLERFKSLVEVIHKFESKILLKRFTLDDFSLDELSELEIDYIRLHKDYCTDVNNNRVTKHAVKNVILHGEMNNIYILGDFVKSDEDYKTLSRLGLYATSR
ncbi:MAG: EAL domain-containing protein [Arcobacteraceae bacterium]